MKISKQMRIVIGAVVVLVIVGFAAKTLLLKSPTMNLTVPPVVHHPHTATALASKHAGRHTVPKVTLDPNLPSALRIALLHHGVVIAVVYASHAPGDDSVVTAARQGAQGAHVGFAALNVANDAVATAVALKIPGSTDPSVAVVKRPGQVTLLLNGYVDSQVVAQAARDAGGK